MPHSHDSLYGVLYYGFKTSHYGAYDHTYQRQVARTVSAISALCKRTFLTFCHAECAAKAIIEKVASCAQPNMPSTTLQMCASEDKLQHASKRTHNGLKALHTYMKPEAPTARVQFMACLRNSPPGCMLSALWIVLRKNFAHPRAFRLQMSNYGPLWRYCNFIISWSPGMPGASAMKKADSV